jgi:hypothetical protein
MSEIVNLQKEIQTKNLINLLLDPNNEEYFTSNTVVISKKDWKTVKAEASALIQRFDIELARYKSNLAIWQAQIAEFKHKYPDYNGSNYQKPVFGHFDETEDHEGPTAPFKPYNPVQDNLYKYLINIINDNVPFNCVLD